MYLNLTEKLIYKNLMKYSTVKQVGLLECSYIRRFDNYFYNLSIIFIWEKLKCEFKFIFSSKLWYKITPIIRFYFIRGLKESRCCCICNSYSKNEILVKKGLQAYRKIWYTHYIEKLKIKIICYIEV